MKGPGGEFDDCCDAGCTRPIPTRDPRELRRLGWEIRGTEPAAILHKAHSPEQPHLVHDYTEWRDAPDTQYVCPVCADTRG